MYTAFRREGLVINPKKVRHLMRELDISSVIRRKRPFAGRKPSVIFPNVLARELAMTLSIYLSEVKDLFNNEIVAWELSDRNDLQFVLNTVS